MGRPAPDALGDALGRSSLPTLVSAPWPDPAVLEAPGGFCWFYCDLVGEDDRALVLIVSWGLPFLPGYASAARAGSPERPLDRPSISLAVVDRARLRFWIVAEVGSLDLRDGVFACELGTVRLTLEPKQTERRPGSTRLAKPAERPPEGEEGHEEGPERPSGSAALAEPDRPGAAERRPGSAGLAKPAARPPLPEGEGGGEGPSPGQEFTLEADLRGVLGDCPWSARIEVRGTRRTPGPSEPVHADHEWNVLCAGATGRAEVVTPSWTWTCDGRAYVDRNAGHAPLHEVSGPWHWGRLALPEADLVWYAAEEGRTVRIHRVHRSRARTELGPAPTLAASQRGRWGQWLPAVVRLPGGEVTLTAVDDSPFYTRFLARGVVEGEPVRGIAEWCVPERIDQAWVRPLVRMAVVPPASPASRWLPLLAGPADGRVGRLLRGWWR